MTGSGQPFVSVIVPAWNSETTLLETLESVAGQTHRSLEIVIVDDASTDSTAAIAEQFCAAEPRARLIRATENQGLPATRNRAIRQSSGEWIAPIDADDLWHPSRLAKMLDAAAEAAETPGFVYCWHRLIDEQGMVMGSGESWGLEGRALCQLAYFNVVGNGSALLLSRDAALAAGLYDEALGEGWEDMMLQLRIALDHPIAAVPEHLVGWRMHGRNMSADLDRMDRALGAVHRRIVGERFPVPPQVLRWVSARSSFELGMDKLHRRQARKAAKHLGRAFRLDPARSALALLDHISRFAVRRIRQPAVRTHHFNDVDPADRIDSGPHPIAAIKRALRGLDERRMLSLAEVEGRAHS